jgi:thiamine biosynthesis lipoprotein
VLVRTEAVMGTMVSFAVDAGDVGADAAHAAVDEACRLLHRADDVFSLWRLDTPMSLVRAGLLPVEAAPPEVAEVLHTCEQVREWTDGWFDPWAMPGGVDPTGLVKGWAAERALDALAGHGIRRALITAGGDVAGIAAPDDPAWRIGIRHPWRPAALAGILVVDRAVATSGRYERGPHLHAPAGRRAAPVASATVPGPRLDLADALATALAVGGADVLDRIRTLAGFDGYLIGMDGTETVTDGIVFAPREPSVRPGTVRAVTDASRTDG